MNVPNTLRSTTRLGKSSRKPQGFTVVYQPIPVSEGTGYYAHIPALGITTDGRTLREAKTMARDAIGGFIDAARELGRSIPAEQANERIEVPA